MACQKRKVRNEAGTTDYTERVASHSPFRLSFKICTSVSREHSRRLSRNFTVSRPESVERMKFPFFHPRCAQAFPMIHGTFTVFITRHRLFVRARELSRDHAVKSRIQNRFQIYAPACAPSHGFLDVCHAETGAHCCLLNRGSNHSFVPFDGHWFLCVRRVVVE